MTDFNGAECRGCGMKLKGDPYHKARKAARHPETGEDCCASFYGGWVCSDNCERAVEKRMRVSIDNYVRSRGKDHD